MEKKQTAVDLFWKQLPEILPSSVDTETGVKLYRAFKQAKQMEKEQMEDAHEIGYINGGNHKNVNGEQYYNETFGGNNE
jgi:hypothetical protein